MSKGRMMGMMGMLAMAAAMGGTGYGGGRAVRDRISPRKKTDMDTLQQRKGLKKFVIEGQEIWALNEKNAQRKAAK